MTTENTATKARRILLDARALLADPAHWFQGNFSNHLGDWRAPDATAFCALGALYKAAGERSCIDQDPVTIRARVALQKVIGVPDSEFIAHWNDEKERKHEEVLAAFDRAAASLEVEP